MAIISNNIGKTITFWQEWSEENTPEPAIIIGKDSGQTFYLEQEGRTITLSSHEALNFAKVLLKFIKDNK